MSTLTNPVVGQGRRLYACSVPESPYGTAQALTHVLVHALDFPPIRVKEDTVPDTEFSSGLATDQETRLLVRGNSLPLSIPILATIETIPLFLAKACGSDIKVVGPPATHTIEPADLPNYLVGMTLEEHLGGVTPNNARDLKVMGLPVDSLELAWQETGWATLTLGFKGSGRSTTPTVTAEAGLIIPMDFLDSTKFRVSIEFIDDINRGISQWDGTHEVAANAGQFPTLDASAADISHLISKGVFRIRNNSSEGKQGGSSVDAGFYRGQVLPSGRIFELQLTSKVDNVNQLLLHMAQGRSWTTQKECTLHLDIAGHTANMGGQITTPLARLLQEPDGLTGPGIPEGDFIFRARKTSGGTDRPIISGYFANGDNIDYC